MTTLILPLYEVIELDIEFITATDVAVPSVTDALSARLAALNFNSSL